MHTALINVSIDGIHDQTMKILPNGEWKHPEIATRLNNAGIGIHKGIVEIPEYLYRKIQIEKWNKEILDWLKETKLEGNELRRELQKKSIVCYLNMAFQELSGVGNEIWENTTKW